MDSTISALAQFGFPAMMAGLLLAAYRDLAPKLIAVLEKTADANARVAAALEGNTRVVQHLADTVTWIEKQMIRMDSQRHEDEKAAALR